MPWLATARHLDIEDPRITHRDPALAALLRHAVVILGGGGLAFEYFHDSIAWVTNLRPRVLIWWGAGHNTHLGVGTFLGHGQWEGLSVQERRYPNYLNHRTFDLIGVRDPPSTQFERPPFQYVPCASVMLPTLPRSRAIQPRHELVAYVQKSRIPKIPGRFPVLSNATSVMHNVSRDGTVDPRSIPAAGSPTQAVAFLATGAVVVTNSYHGALWATLLNRPVITLDGWSSKFHKLPVQVLLISTEEFQDDTGSSVTRARALHATQPEIADLLDHARLANLAFARDVGDLLTERRSSW